MARPEIINEVPITLVELKTKLEEVKQRDTELNYRANKTEEYLNQFVTLDTKHVADIKEKLKALNIPRLKDEHIVKVIDLMPRTMNDLKLVLQSFAISINNEKAKSIVDITAKYLPKED